MQSTGNNFKIFDNVEPNPSMNTVENIISQFKNEKFSTVIGLGGGSSLDVAKFVGFKLKKRKIMIPTTFGSGSEVTKISVLTINGKTVIIIINLIKWEVATWLRSDFSSSAKIIKGPKAPGAAENIEVFFSYLEKICRYLDTIKTLTII